MYDQWAEEVEQGRMVGVMMIDLSAAFDMVDHTLMLEKLKLFGLDEVATIQLPLSEIPICMC